MLRIILGVAIVVFIFQNNVADAAVDCSQCHTKDINPIKAKDTIEINENTCLKCHNPDYPPTPIGYNTHLTHIGKYTVTVDYLKRHPKVTESLNCNNCHINIGESQENCKSCHIKNIPHIKPPLGDNCKACHGELDNLFRHPTVDLKIHDLFNMGSNNETACTMCHNEGDKRSLKLANSKIVPIQENYRLCYQCHSGYYNLWNSGKHYSNKTLTITSMAYRMTPSMRTEWEDKWRKENTCANCHNPHNPNELYQLPSNQEIEDATNVSILVGASSYIYMIGILILVVCVAFIIKKKKLKLSEIKKIDISKIKSKLKMPKISMPISISVESVEDDKTEDKKIKGDTEKVKTETDKIEDTKTTEKESNGNGLITKTEKIKKIGPIPRIKKRLLNKNDALFIFSIIAMLGIFYIVFGAFLPVLAVISQSMSPHIEKGDIIFYTDISRIDEIRTHNDSINYDNKYQSFDNYGDVIIYKVGKKTIPYIHRAMYYVDEGEEMWPGGPKAPYAGYVTKGDNKITNSRYDQQLDISRNLPVKKDQIIGVARYRIPYLGYIRMVLP